MKTLGKYQLIEEIGKGPAGTVYRALDTSRNREIALKVFDGATLKSEDLTACALLQHPQIASVMDFGEAEGAVYVASELLAGRSLQMGGLTPMAQKLKLMARVCEGLALAHRSQIAHGNIKPNNIFVTTDQTPKILDLGVARWRPPMTPNYLAPEQILAQSFDARSDVFSVGVVLYELLTGVYPFQAAPGLIPREIVHTEPQLLRKLDPKMPEELERLLTRALAKDPQNRLQKADEFAASLNEIAKLFEEPPKVEKPAVAVLAATPSRKRLPAILAAAVLGIFILGAILSRQSSNASPTKVSNEPAQATSAVPVNNQETKVQRVVVETPKPEPRTERILRGQVSVLWEEGQYAQAMKLVDTILASDPSQVEARAWKKRIRAAQDAEEAMK